MADDDFEQELDPSLFEDETFEDEGNVDAYQDYDDHADDDSEEDNWDDELDEEEE